MKKITFTVSLFPNLRMIRAAANFSGLIPRDLRLRDNPACTPPSAHLRRSSPVLQSVTEPRSRGTAHGDEHAATSRSFPPVGWPVGQPAAGGAVPRLRMAGQQRRGYRLTALLTAAVLTAGDPVQRCLDLHQRLPLGDDGTCQLAG